MANDPIFEPLLVPSANAQPPTVALTAAAGSTATVTIAGGSNNWRGQIAIASAGTGQAAGAVATVTFGTAFGAAPFVILFPQNAASVVPEAEASTPTTTSFQITVGVALVAANTYTWNYLVLQQ